MICGPFHQPAQFSFYRRHFQNRDKRAQFCVGDRLCRKAICLPHNTRYLARAKRGNPDITRLNRHPIGNPVVKRAESGIHYKKADTGCRHGCNMGAIHAWRQGQGGTQ